MGFLKSLKRWLNARDSYYAMATVYSKRPFFRGRNLDRISDSAHASFDATSGEPGEALDNAEFDRETPADELALRNADITRERLRRLRSK